ncbi:hypothetical protein AB0M36_18550 [Actinoplanes sp. NPDC051346]|uniref:hypothetical protein n=1 Tax=Actinoplanes sp. NPDC051346 TaxID=3155048 RepID=UPI00342A43F8
MISNALARSMVVATIGLSFVGVSTAATAAPIGGSNTTAVAQQQPVACSVVQAIAGPLLGAGLPVDQVVDTVFRRLGGLVPVADIRACLGV